MKKMIRVAMMAAAMFLVVGSVAQAQRGGGRGPNMMAILKDSLKVSDAVLAKADSITKAYATLNAPLNEAARGGDADARAKVMANRTKQNDEIKALLTDAQKAELDKFMSAGRRGAPPATR